MKLTFLGTSAANAFPEAFCRCANCQAARRQGGPSLRKRASLLVNDDLLIDLGPDIMSAAQQYGLALGGVQYCLQTHAHADHLDASHFLSRSPGYGVVGAPRLHFYASPGSLREVERLLVRDCAPGRFGDAENNAKLNLAVHPVQPLQPFDAGPYRVIAFPANHDPVVEPLLYAIQSQGRTIFYGTDTAVLSERAWQGFHDFGLRFDRVVLDHTYGTLSKGGDHLNAAEFVEHMARLRREGLLAEGARCLATHIAHDGNPAHAELVQHASVQGYDVAYDGLVVEF